MGDMQGLQRTGLQGEIVMGKCNQASALILVGLCVLASPVSGFSEEPAPHVCFRTIDGNQDGRVDFREFTKVFSDAVQQDFDEIDSNRDGVLSHEEYHDSLGHGKKASEGSRAPGTF